MRQIIRTVLLPPLMEAMQPLLQALEAQAAAIHALAASNDALVQAMAIADGDPEFQEATSLTYLDGSAKAR